jgi:threonine aldolase
MIDIRSDTVTKPTPDMRRAMYEAEVGDDVFGEDPTVNALEEETAALLGKEAALYVSSGTMGNHIGVWVNTTEGDEMIAHDKCHIYLYEASGPAVISRVMVHLLPGERGVIRAKDIEAEINPDDVHRPPSKLVCIENTHNRAGGAVFPLDEIERIAALCNRTGMRFHMDGARLWNASVASGISEAEYAKHVDTAQVCFSKGLGAPLGSAICGTKETIVLARRKRKTLGGGMRQAGIAAAGALFALRNNRERLAEDHANAKRLAEGVSGLPGLGVDVADIETNIAFIEVTAPIAAKDVAARLEEMGVLILATGPTTLRAVTNLDVSAADTERAIEAIQRVSGTLPK